MTPRRPPLESPQEARSLTIPPPSPPLLQWGVPRGYRALFGLRLAGSRPHRNGSTKTNVTAVTCARRCDAAAARDLLQVWACLRYGMDPKEGEACVASRKRFKVLSSRGRK